MTMLKITGEPGEFLLGGKCPSCGTVQWQRCGQPYKDGHSCKKCRCLMTMSRSGVAKPEARRTDPFTGAIER